ncbi:hypothetical protein ACFO1B_21990 [Dactylosporangium siamense]|uniref:Uncharacterized protein n=1 Tax=Dactylosporangium siamense TaxID=685454 RepID=A0A919PVI9_9ACTN|nr:hypothetical protein [Dactylosporangium siamense]GIG50061.1 hypothetical protein Dsi01nite_081020 [Dactylosporangium siamense]
MTATAGVSSYISDAGGAASSPSSATPAARIRPGPTSTGRFISDDALTDVADAQQANGNAYAGNGPATFYEQDNLTPEQKAQNLYEVTRLKDAGRQLVYEWNK